MPGHPRNPHLRTGQRRNHCPVAIVAPASRATSYETSAFAVLLPVSAEGLHAIATHGALNNPGRFADLHAEREQLPAQLTP